jgi:hypothetical protein
VISTQLNPFSFPSKHSRENLIPLSRENLSQISTMSWQSYVDDHLLCDIEGNHLTHAAIIGLDGSVWAQSANFPQVFPFSDSIASFS